MKSIFVFVSLTILVFIISSFKNKLEPDPVAAKLAFPVASQKSNTGSFWGDERDGGRRKHEGVDIFAKKGSDVVAVCNGTIVSVGNGGIGGKTVWLQSDDYGWSAYYAHLNTQSVYEGQDVKKGDVIGTVGNTGNAKYTPSHLHFGIYTTSGAINPLPLIKSAPRIFAPKAQDNDDGTGKKPQELIAKVQRRTIEADNAISNVWRSSFPEKYVCKQLFIPAADPGVEYFVTIKANVVQVIGDKYQVIGKFSKSGNSAYPYSITLWDKKKLFISKDKKLLTESGEQIGTVVWKA
jgi:hypothetical protein